MSDAALAAAIRSAVEVQGTGWSGRGRVGTPDGLADQLTLALASAPDMAEPSCVAAMVGESAQETDWFCSLVEYGGASTRYAPYYGRGCIQLTWEGNYRGFGQWLHDLGVLSDPETFVNSPGLAAEWPYPWLTAIYYFVRHIDAGYWRSSNWNAISGLINAGSASYYVPAYALRANSCDAALSQLAGWAYTGGESMPSAQEIADAVWAKAVTLEGDAPNAGREVTTGVIMAWLDSQFQSVHDRNAEEVWGCTVDRDGLAADDPRQGQPVTMSTVMAWQDAFVADIKNAVDAAAQRVLAGASAASAEPGGTPAASVEPGSTPAGEQTATRYVINSGETLKQVAETYGRTVAELLAANPNLGDGNALKGGDVIVIPPK